MYMIEGMLNDKLIYSNHLIFLVELRFLLEVTFLAEVRFLVEVRILVVFFLATAARAASTIPGAIHRPAFF